VPALLPAIFACLVFLARAPRAGGPSASEAGGRRRAALEAAIATGVVVVVLAEATSRAGCLARGPLAAGWLAAIAGAAVALRRAGPPRLARPAASALPPAWMLTALAAIAALTGLVAVAAPPNTWDAMTYHLARVGHWVQDARVGLFPTPNPREIEMSPFAEFALVQLHLLSGGDRLDNLVQWSAMLGSWLAVSRMAAQLGAGPRGQALAALFVATLPMGILQGSSAQNDHVAGFWLAAGASRCLDLARHGLGGAPLLGAAAALGLGVLTKGTVAVQAPALLIALATVRVRRDGLGLLRPALVGLAVVAALNAGHAARNVAFGNPPLGPTARYRVAELGARPLVSGLVRNASLQLAGPSEAWNDGVERAVRRLHVWLGIDADDPDTTYRGTRFEIGSAAGSEAAPWARDPARVVRHEDHAPSPLHLLLGLAAAAWALVHPRARRDPALRIAVWVGLGAFALFAALLRWQPWHARLHLPTFVLCAPWIGCVVEAWGRRATAAVGGVLAVGALPWLLAGEPRPLLGPSSVLRVPRAAQYLASRPQYAPDYRGAARHLRGGDCRRVGLLISGDSAEYPIRALVRAGPEGDRRFRFDHVAAADGVAVAPRPCAIVAIDPPRADVRLGGARYTAAWSSDSVTVLQPVVSPP
jgi:hypothetical protein